VARESFKELSILGGDRKQLEFLYDKYMTGANHTDALSEKGVSTIFDLGDNLFLRPWFKFLSGGLDTITFKEFVHGLGASAKGRRRLAFDMLVPPGSDIIPLDVFTLELRALHSRAHRSQAEDVMSGTSALLAETASGGFRPFTIGEFQVLTKLHPKVWRDADVLSDHVSIYATSVRDDPRREPHTRYRRLPCDYREGCYRNLTAETVPSSSIFVFHARTFCEIATPPC
jgi:hypothetical protein